MGSYFKGYYLKHQKGNTTVCFIIGRANSGEFIQVITNDKVYHYDSLQGLKFSRKGIRVNLPEMKGVIHYGTLLPLSNNIMGPFRFLPMQCTHSVFSMSHSLNGFLTVDGTWFDFTGGLGYIEGDRGRSFPKKYLWLHCNNFKEPLSIMASVADIPFLGFHFMGCICAICYQGKEYRLATYRGVKILRADSRGLILTQGRYRLEAAVTPQSAHPLKSPMCGKMEGMIHESNNSKARFRFFDGNRLVFDQSSENTSFECNL